MGVCSCHVVVVAGAIHWHSLVRSWQNLAHRRLQAPRLVSNRNGCLEYCYSACWQNYGISITTLNWSPMCSALKQTTYTLWMKSDLGLNVYLCAVRVLLILVTLVCSHRILTRWNIDESVMIRWDRFAPQFPGTFIWSSPRLDNKTHESPIKSHSRRSTVCCCTRTCWHVLPYFQRACRSNSTFSDAHAHIIENGFMMELPLAGSTSVQGEIQLITLLCLTEY